MRILLLHNYYKDAGGEDTVVNEESALLQSHGHTVELLTESNSHIGGLLSKVRTSCRAVYSVASQSRVSAALRDFRPDIVHVHNFFPQLSPSVYYACKKAKVPVVQTLHNYRLICSNALLFREGMPCEKCVGKLVSWPAIKHACYRKSYSGSAVIATMAFAHKLLRTWDDCVDAYIVLSEFAKERFVAAGIQSRMFVKPNCVTPDPGARVQSSGFGLFVGRLSAEKGLRTLTEAWGQLQGRKLRIIGDGPLKSTVEQVANPDIEYLGRKTGIEVLGIMGEAGFLVFPSECYENCPRVILEAFSRGVPVIASRIGSAQEFVRDGYTGLLFRSGDSADLARKAAWLFDHPYELSEMSKAARGQFLTKYTGEQNYRHLIQIYNYASDRSRQRNAN